MGLRDLESRMRANEAYHGLTVPPDAQVIIRVDGRAFSRLTGRLFTKPFDERFAAHMRTTAHALLTDLQGVLAYTESDEISVVLRPGAILFDGGVEKLVSVSAGVASAAFTATVGHPAHFDSRLWLGTGTDDVLDYLGWRQADAARCAANGWAYWTLRHEGRTRGEATAALRGLGTDAMLRERGIDIDAVPLWQRRGVLLSWHDVEHAGVDPRTGETARTTRRRVVTNAELPTGEAYRSLLVRLLRAGTSDAHGP
jgi:tRNA(His) guanylyltransferase